MYAFRGQVRRIAAALDPGVSSLSHKQEESQMHHSGDCPSDRVGNVQTGGSGIDLEHRCHPHQTQTAGAHQGGNHGDYRVPQATEHTHQRIHNTADKIEPGDISHTDYRLSDYIVLPCLHIESGQRIAEIIGQIPQHKSRDRHEGQAQLCHPVHPVALARAVILSHKGDGRLIKRVHGGINKAFNIGPRRRPGHQYRIVKGVQRGLDHHVGQGKDHALKARGQANLKDSHDHKPLQLQLFQVQMQRPLLFHQAAQHQNRGYVLGNNRSQGHARHIHMEYDNQNQIQNHIDDSGKKQVIEGPLRISLGPQNSRAEVIEHVGRHAEKVYSQIDRGQINDISGRGHPFQQLTDHNDAKNHHNHAADERQGDGGMDILSHAVIPAGAQIPGDHHVGAYR